MKAEQEAPRLDQERVIEPKLHLPAPPPTETGAVKVWREPVPILTYQPGAPDPNPLFLEKRVYQGSSGRVYPLPVIDSVETKPAMRTWDAVHLENEFLRLMVMPEIGGRIHVGLDKRNGYDFFYRQNVIKPALVGLAGPWISGGVEFNWPQHHRPATFMPVEIAIERDPDGSVTVWCSDHDPMARMKGMHGICLRPGKAYVEVKVRLYNRTVDTQTFLWWANVATRVHEHYQSFFPHDVRFVADHAKRAVTSYPLSDGAYYGVDYGERARNGVPEEDLPPHFVPEGSYAVNDLGWYANISVPTSYMIVGSQGDFFGGYDHAKQAGTVAFANHHIAPGKKQWTWGNHNFGYAWDRSLTDADGPYVELMSGVYTDNQPDFSFLAPGETKTFSQFWYPISETGVPDLATLDGALRVDQTAGRTHIRLQVTAPRQGSIVLVLQGDAEIARWEGDLEPAHTLDHVFLHNVEDTDLTITVEHACDVLLRYAPREIVPVAEPEVATEPPLPPDVATADELFLIGVHLEQYRHPTRAPEAYWREALRRDAGDARCNGALGRWHLRRGEFTEAERHLRASIARLTSRNPNPQDGEPHYDLGLALSYQGRVDEAYAAFYKSTWVAAWRGPAYQRLAEIDISRRDWAKALDHLDRSLRAEADNLNARNLRTIVLRKLHRSAEADEIMRDTRALDLLDIFSRWLAAEGAPRDGQQRLDLIFDLQRSGLFEEALAVATEDGASADDGTEPLLLYVRAHLLDDLGRAQESEEAYQQAAKASPALVFPSRLEIMLVLQRVIRHNPRDAHAPFFLGNLLYDRRRHEEAISHWEQAIRLDPNLATAWRNLGIAYYNVLHDLSRALHAFAQARAIAPQDARILYEQDQLFKRTGAPLGERLAALEANRDLVERRDDLSVELASLYNNAAQPRAALEVLLGRQFQPWEGGEGLVLGQFVRAHVLLAREALDRKDAEAALRHLHQTANPPLNLSEAKHLLANFSMVDYWTGVAYAAAGQTSEAAKHWQRAAKQVGDFQQMQVQYVSEATYWSALALSKLGREHEAQALFESMLDFARDLEQQEPTIDYFATSLPAMLLFEESLRKRQTLTARFLEAEALFGLGRTDEGSDRLRLVLALDSSHAGAIDFARMVGI